MKMKTITPTTSRVRTSFDPEHELPRLHQWFAENPHPSRLTLQMYVKELNKLVSRQSRKLLEVHNLCYWFKNARAAYKRAESRMRRQTGEREPVRQVGQHYQASHHRSLNGLGQFTRENSFSASLNHASSHISSSPLSPLSPFSSLQETNSNNNKDNNNSIKRNNGSNSSSLARETASSLSSSGPFESSSERRQLGGKSSVALGRVDVQLANEPLGVRAGSCGPLDGDLSASPVDSDQHARRATKRLLPNFSLRDNKLERSSRDNSRSPGSTSSLPTKLVPGAGSSSRAEACASSRSLAKAGALNGNALSDCAPGALNNVELAAAAAAAAAVNCLLSTASNFTAVAAAAAAAAAASAAASSSASSSSASARSSNSTLAHNMNAPAAGSHLLQLHSNALGLAAGLLNTKPIDATVGGCGGGGGSNHFSNNNANFVCSSLAAAALSESPLRNTFTVFNPIDQKLALGFLDNHHQPVDTKATLNNTIFPTSYSSEHFSGSHFGLL